MGPGRGDVPVTADFDGDGKTDIERLAGHPPGNWFIRYSSLNYSVDGYGHYQWGASGDALISHGRRRSAPFS